jgi:hypothetical protein
VSSAFDERLPLLTGAQLLDRRLRERRKPLATSVDTFDRLQGGGLARGAMIELCGPRSSGRFAIALAALAAATAGAESAALIDGGDHLDPQQAKEAGVDLERLLWLRPRVIKQALLAAETVLAAGFSLVVLDCGELPVDRVPDASWRRLARGAIDRAGTLLLITPRPTAGAAAQAVVRADKSRPIWEGAAGHAPLLSGIAVRLNVERGASGSAGGASLALPVKDPGA